MLYVCVAFTSERSRGGDNESRIDGCVSPASVIYIYMHGMLKDVMHMVLRESDCMMQDKDVP